jgi:hypothetical protein
MIKQSFAEFKQSDMIKPFYVKAKQTLNILLFEMSQNVTLKHFIDKYRDITLKNTLKILYRCKLEFSTRNLLVEVFQSILKYETHASMLKDMLQ